MSRLEEIKKSDIEMVKGNLSRIITYKNIVSTETTSAWLETN